MISKALIAFILSISISTITQDATTLDDEKAVEYVLQLKNDAACTVINSFMFRNKSILISELFAMGQIKDLNAVYSSVLEPLADDAQVLANDILLVKMRLKKSNLDLKKIEEMMMQASTKEIKELTGLWANSFGLNNSGIYVGIISAKQDLCRKHINSIAGTRT